MLIIVFYLKNIHHKKTTELELQAIYYACYIKHKKLLCQQQATTQLLIFTDTGQ
jgi:hypothetical protein